MDKMNPYYYEQLSPEEQHFYRLIQKELYRKDNIINGNYEIPIGVVKETVSLDCVSRIMQNVLNAVHKDDPWIFWCDFSQSVVVSTNRDVILKVATLYSVSERVQLEKKLAECCDELTEKIKEKDILYREKGLYKYLKENIRYVDSGKPEEHSIVGALLHGEAVCEGIAQAFSLLCRKLKIPCITIHGKVTADAEEWHAWNLVRVMDQLFYVDLTYDLPSRKKLRYFNVSTEEFQKDHIVSEKFPICGKEAVN